MRTYPIMLNLHDRLAVVVGGGSVGLRKARSLLAAGARVRLCAARIDPDADLDGVELLHRPYDPETLDGAFLVFACTDDEGLNARIARDARRIGALVNVADRPAHCDFYLPATIADGDVVIAVGTGGCSPALSAWLKRRLAGQLPEKLGEFAALLESLRGELQAEIADSPQRMAVMKRLVDAETCSEFVRGGPAAVRERFRRLLDASKDT